MKCQKRIRNNFSDSKRALNENKFLTSCIDKKGKKLEKHKPCITFWKIPNHSSLIDNEKADQVARNKAEQGR